jgi:hypothetical protein
MGYIVSGKFSVTGPHLSTQFRAWIVLSDFVRKSSDFRPVSDSVRNLAEFILFQPVLATLHDADDPAPSGLVRKSSGIRPEFVRFYRLSQAYTNYRRSH